MTEKLTHRRGLVPSAEEIQHRVRDALAASGNGTIGLNLGPSVHGTSTKKNNHRCLPLSTFRLSLPILPEKRRSDEDHHKPSFTVNRMALQKTKGWRRATDAANHGKEMEEEETERHSKRQRKKEEK
ncbi:hypothetical protein M9H77_10771 [Catharanthus roseus]|uniref:Uncharacterized protein n=1 Tax=Catharanthus roseus TaxID=4058 RepID=A0ACC0BCT5_CATRO|nr:hypothetical protein M9H77_10771 [Catharanthus roseus]